MTTTRDEDIGALEEMGRKDLAEKVWRQTQNPEIERLRQLLADAHRRRDFKMVDEIGEELSRYNKGGDKYGR